MARPADMTAQTQLNNALQAPISQSVGAERSMARPADQTPEPLGGSRFARYAAQSGARFFSGWIAEPPRGGCAALPVLQCKAVQGMLVGMAEPSLTNLRRFSDASRTRTLDETSRGA